MDVKLLQFRFKGSRNYIHGTDMFNTLLAYSGDKAVSNIRFSVHGIVHKPVCELYMTCNKNELNNIHNILARCQFDTDGTTHWLALAEKNADNFVTERYEYDEDSIVSLCQLNHESLSLKEQSPFSFIETVVAMNKHLHQQLFPEVAGKWMFTRIDLDAPCDERKNLTVKLVHNMNYRLTKADVLVNDKKQGEIFFSLVKS